MGREAGWVGPALRQSCLNEGDQGSSGAQDIPSFQRITKCAELRTENKEKQKPSNKSGEDDADRAPGSGRRHSSVSPGLLATASTCPGS